VTGGQPGDSDADRFEELQAVRSPLAAFFLEGSDTREEQALLAEQAREDAIQDCMIRQGFSYERPANSTITFSSGLPDDLPIFAHAWTAKYGFGFSTTFFQQSAIGPDLIGKTSPAPQVELSDNEPNPLGESEQAAYTVALAQCRAEGDAAYEQADPVKAFAAAFPTDFSDLADRVLAHERLIEHDDQVARCAASNGHTYDRTALWKMFGAPAQELHDSASARATGPTLELNAAERRELAKLQDAEIDLALAVFECGGGPLERFELVNEIRREVEGEYIDRNRDALQTLRDG